MRSIDTSAAPRTPLLSTHSCNAERDLSGRQAQCWQRDSCNFYRRDAAIAPRRHPPCCIRGGEAKGWGCTKGRHGGRDHSRQRLVTLLLRPRLIFSKVKIIIFWSIQMKSVFPTFFPEHVSLGLFDFAGQWHILTPYHLILSEEPVPRCPLYLL